MNIAHVVTAEWIHLGVCLALLAAFEWRLRRASARAPMSAARSAHAAIRSQWVRSVMSRPGTEILVIQTLRNSGMAASFMATTAILALSATLTFSGIGDHGNGMWQSVRGGHAGSMIFAAMLLLLAACFFISFFFMAMSVRFFNHTGYVITGDFEDRTGRSQSLATAYLNRAGHYYSLGLRAFFSCVPFLAGLFSVYLAVPATLLLILVLYWFDQVPRDER